MKINFLDDSKESFRWFANYYEEVFGEGKIKAYHVLESVLKGLKVFPNMGNSFDVGSDLKVFHLPNTPFSIIYFVTVKEVKILRILDTRNKYNKSDIVSEFLRLKKKK